MAINSEAKKDKTKFTVTCTPEQYDLIFAAAKEVGLGVPAYCRMTVIERLRVNGALDAQKKSVDFFQRLEEKIDALEKK